MPRFLLVLLLVAAAAAPAAAQTRAVKVTSTPSGAMVYLGDKEQGPVGVTPIMLKLKPGEQGLIIELDGYQPVVQTVKVPKGKGPALEVAVALLPAVGVLLITGDDAFGATVRVDDAERGKVPLRLELEAGAHHVQVATDPPYEEFVEIKAGDERLLAVEVVPPPPPPPPVVERGPARGKPLIIARVGTELGWRRFSYEGAASPTTQTYTGKMLALIRIDLELAPWRLSRAARRIWPLALVIGGGIAPVGTARVPDDDQLADAYWRTMDIGLRYPLRLLAGQLVIGFEAGWTRNLYQFRGQTDVAIEEKLPDVDYNMVRFGARIEGHRGPLTGWFGLDNRIILGEGVVADRYQTAEVSGYSVRLGAMARLAQERFRVGVEYGRQRYGWELEPFPPPNMNVPSRHPATAATDSFHGLQIWLGGQY